MRWTMISRCSSPIPEMMVWPDSSSVRTRNDGSSCARRPSAMPIFSWSTFVFGSTACEMTGSGNTMRSSVIDFFTSLMVSPVITSFRPTTAAMSQAQALLDLVDRKLAGLEVLVHQLFVRFGRSLDHLLVPLLRLRKELGRNRLLVELHALGRFVPIDRLHRHQVDDAGERVFQTDR